MKESIAQAFILNLILFFFVILVLLLFGSINYSKAYKVKNRIITIIEKYGGYTDEETIKSLNSEIVDNMVKAGYQTTTDGDEKCKKLVNNGELVYPLNDDFIGGRRYDYCVVRHKSSVGEYYQVVVYMKFEIPIIGGFLEFPVKGETKALYANIEG